MGIDVTTPVTNVLVQSIGGPTGPVGPAGPPYSGVVTPEDFGAVGSAVTARNGSGEVPTTGLTDDTLAFQQAMTFLSGMGGGTLQLGARQYLVSTFDVPNNVAIVGYPNASVLLTDSDETVVNILGERVGLRDFNIASTNRTATPNQHGVRSRGSYVRASGIRCDYLYGRGFWISDLSTPLLGPQFTGCIADHCNEVGWYLECEYTKLTNCDSFHSVVGIYVGAGNLNACGCSFIAGSTGIRLALVGNDGHGVFSGCTINHNTINVYAEAIQNGMNFTGCEMFYGTMQLVGSRGVIFVGGQVDIDAYVFDGSRGTVFSGVQFPSDLANAITNNANGHDSTTRWLPSCVTKDGDFPSFVVTDETLWNSPFAGSIQLLDVADEPVNDSGGVKVYGLLGGAKAIGADGDETDVAAS